MDSLNKVEVMSTESSSQDVSEPEKSWLKPDDVSRPAKKQSTDIKFFKCCSASIKRFSILIFIIGLFTDIAIAGALAILVAVYLTPTLLVVLAFPIFTVFIILVVFTRFVCSLVYGFGEIVEKCEK